MSSAQTRFPLDRLLVPLLSDLGVRPATVLRAAGLPDDLLEREEALLSTEEFFRFWSALEEQVEAPAFPVHLAERMTAEVFVPPLFAALCSPHLVTAAQRIIDYKRLMGPGGFEMSRPNKRLLKVKATRRADKAALPHSLVIAEFATIVKVARMGTRVRVKPVRLTTRKALSPKAAYLSYFGVSPDLGRDDAIWFSEADAERPFVTENEAMWEVFEPKLRTRLSALTGGATTRQRVRAVLLELLPAGDASAETVARRLATSQRTLQRQLSAEGATYSAMLSTVRSELANHYLTSTDLGPSQIAYLLGFDNPRSFFRAFRSWSGTSPERFRAARTTGTPHPI